MKILKQRKLNTMNKICNNILLNKITDILNDERIILKNNKNSIHDSIEGYLDVFLMHLIKYKVFFSAEGNIRDNELENFKDLIRASSIIFTNNNLGKHLTTNKINKFYNQNSKNSNLFLILCNVIFYTYKYAQKDLRINELYKYLLTKVNFCEEYLSSNFETKKEWNCVNELFDELGLQYNSNEVKFINKMSNFNQQELVEIGKILSLSKILVSELKSTFLIEFKEDLLCPYYENIVTKIKEDFECFETFTHFGILLTVSDFRKRFIETKIKKYKEFME